MTEVSNLFSNFNDLTKKSVTDLSTDYNSKGSNPTDATPALTQGKKFKSNREIQTVDNQGSREKNDRFYVCCRYTIKNTVHNKKQRCYRSIRSIG